MHWTPRAVRIGVVVALLLPAAVILLSSSLQAQIKPPPPFQPPPQPKFQPPPPFQPPPQPKFQPPPPIQPPVFQNVWTCGKCGKQIGTGAAPPGTCPFCGVRIINGVDQPNANAPPPNPNPNPPMFNPPPPNPPAVGNAPNKPESQRSNTGLLIALIGGGLVFACVLFAGIGVGIYYAINGGTPKKSGRSPRRRRGIGDA